MLLMLGLGLAHAGEEVWLDFDHRTRGGRLELHVPAVFEPGGSTVTTRSGEEVDLADVARRLASERVGKKEKLKLQTSGDVRQKLILRHEQSDGPGATQLVMSGTRGGQPMEKTLPLSGDRMELGQGAQRKGRGRKGGGSRLDRIEDTMPWTFRLDEARAMGILRGWEPTEILNVTTDEMDVRVRTE
ncbi:MAG: hypothetical protein H6738_08325 [Alphaproteobacteria bacterium]|nr:hypothetical protein [Alphaproteobacteria bacterium]MCB9696766.1 hypothetical protein [Alphaproteobacteria bacterium]